MATEIKDDDRAYLAWLASHPDGFVINTTRAPRSDYVVLHRATCGTISGMPARGIRWTTGAYLKICSTDRADLERCARHKLNAPLHPCSLCTP